MGALVVVCMVVAALAMGRAWLLLLRETVHVFGGVGACWRVVAAAVPAAVPAAVVPWGSVTITRVLLRLLLLLLLGKTIVVRRCGRTGCWWVGSVALVGGVVSGLSAEVVMTRSDAASRCTWCAGLRIGALLLRRLGALVRVHRGKAAGSGSHRGSVGNSTCRREWQVGGTGIVASK